MCFFTITAKYNEPLEDINRDSDYDRYDIVGCGAAGRTTLDLLRELSLFEALICFLAIATKMKRCHTCSVQ